MCRSFTTIYKSSMSAMIRFAAKSLVTTIVWLSFLCNFMNAVIKRIHVAGADT